MPHSGSVDENDQTWNGKKTFQREIGSLSSTIQAAGQTGAKTANTQFGNIRIAAAGTSVVVTNSLVTANSLILCTLLTADATATFIKSAVPGAGSFTITVNAAATAEINIAWAVIN